MGKETSVGMYLVLTWYNTIYPTVVFATQYREDAIECARLFAHNSKQDYIVAEIITKKYGNEK